MHKVADTVTTQSSAKAPSDIVTSPTRFFVKGDKKQHQIDLNNLNYIEAYGNYTKLFLKDQMIVSHEKISHYEMLLSNNDFLRVHKSFIVSISKIKFIEGNRIIIGDSKVPIGQTYKSRVQELFNG